MTDKGQVTANWGQLLIDEAKIIVNVSEYNPMQEKRILIPYISRQNSKNERNKIGLLNANGEIVVKPDLTLFLMIVTKKMILLDLVGYSPMDL